MQFKPLYLQDRINKIDPSNPEFKKNKLNIVNPNGTAGIVTLWREPETVWKALLKSFPNLFQKDSPLVALTSLYGNGLPQMLANLAYNPQIQYLAVTGNDTPVVPSFSYLDGFLKGRTTEEKIGGIPMIKINDTSFAMDAQLSPKMLSHLRTERFKPSELERIAEFISQKPHTQKSESERLEIKLIEPEFKDFPSDITNHNISAQTPIDAWMQVMYTIDRFGATISLPKGERRALFNLDVSITNPGFEPEEELIALGFNPQELRDYQKDILSGDLAEGTSYTYGNRLRAYWGADTLKYIAEQLQKDKLDRYQLVSLWDTGHDLLQDKGHPCFTDAYFTTTPNGKLMMTSSFRTHNATAAYLTNLYGLRAIQEEVSRMAGLQPGQLNVRSRWIGIDPSNSKTAATLAKIKEMRKVPINVHDPRGYFIIYSKEREIVAEHYSPDAQKLGEYRGKTAKELKDQLRQTSAVSNPDHAMWIGYELAKAHYEIHKEIPEM